MSMVQELIAAVTSAERTIDDQIAKLSAFKAQLDEVAKLIDSALSGSVQSYIVQMTSQLAQARKQVDDTMSRLQTAKEKLTRVRMI